MTSSNVIMLAATGSAAILLMARTAFVTSKKSSNEKEKQNEEEELNPSDCVQADDVIAVFDDLFIHMQSVLAQLSQQIQQIQMSGQMIPEKQLREIFKAEFERALLAKQKSVFEKHDVDEECLRDATWEMLKNEDEYPKVKRSVERFQKLYENVSGAKVVGRQPGNNGKLQDNEEIKCLTKEKLIESATIYFDALTSAMRTVALSYKNEGKNLRDPSVAQSLQMKFGAVANDAGEAALQELGVTLDCFKASIEKHQENPDVGRVLVMLQMKQQQELVAVGVHS